MHILLRVFIQVLNSRRGQWTLPQRHKGLHEEMRQQWRCGDAIQTEGGRGHRRREQRWSSWCPHKSNSLTTSLSPKWDEWTSWDFIWIRNEAWQRKPIRHHFPHWGQARNRPEENHLLRLILYCIPPVTLKPSIAPLSGMNQDMGSPNPPQGRSLREKKWTAPSGLCNGAMGSWWPSFPMIAFVLLGVDGVISFAWVILLKHFCTLQFIFL